MRSRRVGALAAMVSLVLPLIAPAPAAGVAARGPDECAATLDCTAEEINLMSMPERAEFVRDMSEGPAAELLPGYQPRWRNIEGVIAFFDDYSLGEPGSWISYVDAGIVEGIERGIALALGEGTDDFGNPGSVLWAEYLTRLADGELEGRAAHDEAWSVAEQAATEHGVHLAEEVHGVEPSGAERRYYTFSEFYRWMMRNRLEAFDILAPPVEPGEREKQHFVDWFTDVTTPDPSYRGSVMAYEYATLDVPGGTLGALLLFRAYLAEMYEMYTAEQGG
ncbi:hypothetical protein H0B56_02870 [Haloechinothrix sp. YIM 98757]|uniref:Uncharacterized protein n=1 Tax=Haloechinothrix aidingensis TaxID=2752311 RepID=A0A838A7Z6_9PSEU|nr:hypothetical protein [Haloechinothrix aidingensis]MBA0124479.1 hypothetical protein [Haloechinothrix aidingensis]